MPSSPDQGLAKLVRYLQDVSSRPGPHDLRASDADRDLVITMLSEAAGDGRLSLDEHAERSEKALVARTLGELVQLTSDLSGPSGQPIRLYPRRAVTALFARERRQGRWVVPDSFPVTAFFGDVTLDLRDAILPSHRVTIHVTAVAGQVRLIVPEGIAVEMPGRAVLGIRSVRGARSAKPSRGRSRPPEQAQPQCIIEVRTTTIGGSVKAVVVRPPRRRPTRRRPPI